MQELQKKYSLRTHNTFKLESRADYYMRCSNISDLQDFAKSNLHEKHPVLVLGEGSNILFAGDVRGIVLHPAITGIEITGTPGNDVHIRAGAGVNWDELVAWTVKQGFWGIENLSLIPGSAGAAPVQNIGAYGIELEEVLHYVETVNLKNGLTMNFSREECAFGYRYSLFKKPENRHLVITHINLKLSTLPRIRTDYGTIRKELEGMDEPALKDIREAIIRIRQSKLPDPQEVGNAGSFFKNPVISTGRFAELHSQYPGMPFYSIGQDLVKVPAAWLIEQAGWKGRNKGNTGTWPLQPLVLINLGSATGKEIIQLAGQINDDIEKKFGFRLEREVNVI